MYLLPASRVQEQGCVSSDWEVTDLWSFGGVVENTSHPEPHLPAGAGHCAKTQRVRMKEMTTVSPPEREVGSAAGITVITL